MAVYATSIHKWTQPLPWHSFRFAQLILPHAIHFQSAAEKIPPFLCVTQDPADKETRVELIQDSRVMDRRHTHSHSFTWRRPRVCRHPHCHPSASCTYCTSFSAHSSHLSSWCTASRLLSASMHPQNSSEILTVQRVTVPQQNTR